MQMRRIPAILSTATLVALSAGCGGHGPYLSEQTSETVLPTTEPSTAPAARPAELLPLPSTLPVIRTTEVSPSPRPATAPSVKVRIAVEPVNHSAPRTTRAALPKPIVTTSPASGPATAPSTSASADQASFFSAALAEIARGDKPTETSNIAGLSLQEQRTLVAILEGIQEFSSSLHKQSVRNSLISLLDMADRIRGVAPLRIPEMALCSKVDGYGVYESLEPQFPAGREFPLVVYCEVTGFSSRVGERAMWETRLSQEIQLVDASNAVVWRDGPSTVVDTCRNRRRDFYVARVIRIPATISAGKYTLTTLVTDQISKESSQVGRPIELVSEQP